LVSSEPRYRTLLRPLGFGLHAVTGPIVHWIHGYGARGFGSFAMNVGSTFTSVWIGAYAGKDGLPFVLGASTLAAQIIDATWLAYEDVRVPLDNRAGARLLLPSSVGVVPMFDEQQKGVWLVGQF
jgi:hypothetical protein